jgi:hypothetical protein
MGENLPLVPTMHVHGDGAGQREGHNCAVGPTYAQPTTTFADVDEAEPKAQRETNNKQKRSHARLSFYNL